MIHLTDPAASSDFRLIKTDSGTLLAAVEAWTNIGFFNIPQLLYEDRVLVLVEALKADTLDLAFISANTSDTSASSATSTPCYMKIANYYAWARSDINRSFDDTLINYHNVLSAGAQVITSRNNSWGDIDSAKTIYVNMKTNPLTDIYWKFSAWIMKKNIK